jgi:basic amino acid/polyamine antiporter, APA family
MLPLKRELGLTGAMVTGLGSIIGTGAFVAVGLASAEWGDALLWAIPLAGLVAMFNGLSSAFLAGRFPVAGGTYEYGYETLGPAFGFIAGWLFLLAKTASAATAALGLALYLDADDRAGVALILVVAVTLLVLSGLRRTTLVNMLLLVASVAGLVAFSIAGLAGFSNGWSGALPGSGDGPALGAVAFLFVAYTGYGRIATLGEEVHSPHKTIPRAVILTLVISVVLYLGVELGGRSLGGSHWGTALELGVTLPDLVADPVAVVVAVGAVTAMLGVLLNLVLGLSRVWLAMGRRGDMPAALSRLDSRSNPSMAVAVAGALVAVVTLAADIRAAWSFSAMTVLLYYGITNLAALRVDRGRVTAWAGLASCLFLSFFVPLQVWLLGLALIGGGLLWKVGFSARV